MKKKYYGLYDKTNSYITESWDEALELIKTMVAPRYKGFSTLEQAKAFIKGEELILDDIDPKEPRAYIDGSYDVKTGNYSFGGVLIIGNQIYSFNKKYENDEYSSMRNVAGEIKGAGFITQYAINQGIKRLHIFFDYNGIEKWATGEWKAKSSIAVEYVAFCQRVRSQIQIIYHKVKSHSNDYYNDMADKLAKDALGI